MVPADTFRTDVFVVIAFIRSMVAKEELKTETFVVKSDIALPIKLFTHAVVGTLEELSEVDNSVVIFGFIKKVAGVFILKLEDRLSDPIFTLHVEPIFISVMDVI